MISFLDPHRYALTPRDRRLLHGGGDLAFRPGSAPPPENRRKFKRKAVSKYGSVRDAARRFAAGEFGDKHTSEVAKNLRLDSESLKAAVWKVRHDAKKRRAA